MQFRVGGGGGPLLSAGPPWRGWCQMTALLPPQESSGCKNRPARGAGPTETTWHGTAGPQEGSGAPWLTPWVQRAEEPLPVPPLPKGGGGSPEKKEGSKGQLCCGHAAQWLRMRPGRGRCACCAQGPSAPGPGRASSHSPHGSCFCRRQARASRGDSLMVPTATRECPWHGAGLLMASWRWGC